MKFEWGDMVADRNEPNMIGEITGIEGDRYCVTWDMDEGPFTTWVAPDKIVKYQED